MNPFFKSRSTDSQFERSSCRPMFKSLRRTRLKATPLPVRWRRIIEEYCLFYSRLSAADRKELEGHVQIFLAEKQFEGCGGFVVGDEHRLTIAAEACLLLLHRKTDYYPALKTILIYPGSYTVPTTRHIGSGVMREMDEHRSGESWSEGAVVLAWSEVYRCLTNPETGSVTIHEFAHQLDYEDGGHADGVPLLGQGESLSVRKRRQTEWTQVMRTEYEQLRERVQRGEPGLLRDYGATNPAEFFAVVTECFFCRPRDLRQIHPTLYEQMSRYYKQDPAEWGAS
jgi:Mlc titration factor MtfA (ptsG expression regulator)